MPRSYVHAESNVARVPRLKLWAVHPYMMRPSLGQLREAQASVAKERAQVRRQLFSAVNVVCKVGLGALAAAQRPRRTTSVATMTTVQVSSQAEIESDGAVHGSPRPHQVRSSGTRHPHSVLLNILVWLQDGLSWYAQYQACAVALQQCMRQHQVDVALVRQRDQQLVQARLELRQCRVQLQRQALRPAYGDNTVSHSRHRFGDSSNTLGSPTPSLESTTHSNAGTESHSAGLGQIVDQRLWWLWNSADVEALTKENRALHADLAALRRQHEVGLW